MKLITLPVLNNEIIGAVPVLINIESIEAITIEDDETIGISLPYGPYRVDMYIEDFVKLLRDKGVTMPDTIDF